jgi:hypothetical protein
MASTGEHEGSRGVYMVVVSSVYGGFRRKRLGGVGGFSGRRCTLSSAMWSRLSVVERCGRGSLGF